MKTKLIFITILVGLGLFLDAQDHVEVRDQINPAESTLKKEAGKRITFWPGSGCSAPGSGGSFTAQINSNLPVTTPPEPMLFSAGYENIDNVAIDKSLTYGALAVAPTINNRGQAKATIEFPIPEDPFGIMGSLKLEYNSDTRDGLWGRAWSIASMGIIQREPSSSFYDDGLIDPADMDGRDRFTLNGQRLLLKSINENYGSDGAQYETEFASFQQITSHGVHMNGPDYFTVKTKNNITYFYGLKDNSKLDNGQGYVYWLLDKVVDAYGNTVQYRYKEKTGENGTQVLLESIRYGCPEGRECLYETVFEYDFRPNYVPSYYAHGMQMQYKYLVTKMKVYGHSSLFAEYDLEYSLNNRPLLRKITTTDKDGSTYNPLLLEWHQQKNSAILESEQQSQSGLNIEERLVSGDFNGDGYEDFASYPSEDSTGKVRVYLNNRDNNHPKFNYHTQLTWTPTDYKQKMFATDVDNDGYTDLVKLKFVCTDQLNGECSEKKGYLKIYRNDNGNDFDKVNAVFREVTGNLAPGADAKIIFMNFDGDRFLDIAYYERNTDKIKIRRIVENTGNPANLKLSGSTLTLNLGYNILDLFPARFDDDERTDFLVFDGNSARALRLKESGSGNFNLLTISRSNPLFSLGRLKRPGDFNGDGLTDIFTVGTNGSNGKIFHFTGNEFVEDNDFKWPNELMAGFTQPGKTVHKVHIDFFTNDPFSDVLLLAKESNYSLDYHQFYFNASGNYNYEVEEQQWMNEPAQTSHEYGVTGYFYGDSKKSLLHFPKYNANSVWVRHKSIDRRNYSHHIERLRDGLGVTTEFGYTRMNYPGHVIFYTGDPSEPEGVRQIVNGSPVVRYIKKYNTQGDLSYRNYIYDGFKSLVGKNAFYGITKLYRRNINQNMATKETYKIMTPQGSGNPNFINLLKKSEQYLINPGPGIAKEISTTTHEYALTGHPSALGSTIIEHTKTTTENHLKDVSTVSQMKYDSYLNLTEIVRSVENGSVTIKKEFLNFQNSGAWCPSKPEILKITKSRTGEDPDVLQTFWEYNGKGKPIKEINDYQGAQEISTEYLYNNDGKRIATTINDEGEMRSTLLSYSEEGLLEWESDPEGHMTKYEIDPRTGYNISVTDINGNKTKFETKGFGWLRRRDLSEGYSLYVKQSFDANADGPAGSLYMQERYNDYNSEKQIIYNNDLHQTLREEVTGFDGQMVTVDYRYFANGQLEKESEPYLQGGAPTWNIYSYDDYKRLSSTQSYNGVSYSVNYDGLEKTVTNDQTGQFKTHSLTVDGLLKEVNDNGHIINNSYFSHGHLKSTNGGANHISKKYDNLLRQTELNDKDAGTVKYQYNGFGDLVSQDDNGKVFTMSYDALGRLKDKSIVAPGESRNYLFQYDQGGPGASGQLSQCEVNHDNDLVKCSSNYDKYGREKKYSETIDNKKYTYQYAFSKNGNVRKLTFPSGFSVKYEYDGHGNLKRIRQADNNEVIWKAMEIDAYGRVVKQEFGNGLETEKFFDQHNYPHRIETGTDNFTVQNVTYQFEQTTGNLLSRSNRHGLTESFDYDNLNQLTQIAKGSDVKNISYSVDNAGQIIHNDGIGEYVYATSGGNQLLLVKPPDPNDITTSEIPTLTQEVNYTAFNKVKSIIEGNFEAHFVYGPDEERRKMAVLENGEHFFSRVYVGGAYEVEDHRDNGKRYLHYIKGGDGLAAVYVTNVQGSGTMYYVHKNYQGSITHLTNAQGQLVEEYSFGPWGRRRDPVTGDFNFTSSGGRILDRGFTGHEHLPDVFNVINMNGRIYDPLVGMMMSPDNFVQDNTRAVNYNRYAYVFNNPLKYTDPDGEWVHLVVGAVVGGGINLATNWDNIDGFWEGAAAFGVGAGSGLAAAATGGASLGVQLGVAMGSGAAVSATNNVIAQTDHFNGQVDWTSVTRSAAIGMVASGVGFGASHAVRQTFPGDLVLGQRRIAGHSIPGKAIKEGLAGYAGGYLGGLSAGYLYTGDLARASKFARSGGYLAGGIGAGLGAGAAAFNAKRGGYNPWSGKFTEKSITRTYEIPDGWEPKPPDKGSGIKFVDPNNPHNNYRFMNARPHGSPLQRNPTIYIKLNGHSYDASGRILPSRKVIDAHIQVDKSPHIFIRKPFLD
jgi:RHS repeat-associated protein